MATTTHTITTDDLTGEENAKTHTIAFDGRTYEVDLTDESWDNLIDNELHRLIAVARPIKAKPSKPYTPKPADTAKAPNTLAHIRTWARAQNITINDRGRIPTWITDLYYRENPHGPASASAGNGAPA